MPAKFLIPIQKQWREFITQSSPTRLTSKNIKTYSKKNKTNQNELNGSTKRHFWKTYDPPATRSCAPENQQELRLRLGDGHEDVERSLRFFQRDGALLRYRFLCVRGPGNRGTGEDGEATERGMRDDGEFGKKRDEIVLSI